MCGGILSALFKIFLGTTSASGHLVASEHVFLLKEDVSHLELLQEICYIAVKVIYMVSFSMNFGKYEYHTESERCMRSM
jgi:hypothetical protein